MASEPKVLFHSEMPSVFAQKYMRARFGQMISEVQERHIPRKVHVCPNLLTNSYLIRLDVLLGNDTGVYDILRHYLAPGGGCELLFSPCLSVCLCVCVSVCPANILVFYFSAIRRDIDICWIWSKNKLMRTKIKLNFFIVMYEIYTI